MELVLGLVQGVLQRKRLKTTMKPLPKTIEELANEAESIGGMEQDIHSPRMELIKAAWDGSSIRRSISRGSILFVGSSGVGKSSTINHLFGLRDGHVFAKINNKESETRSTTEYILRGNHPKYEVKNLELSLVDSPGSNDTEGVAQDACNLYSVKRFYTEHPELNGCYPSLIFIVVGATDDRTSGPNSDLAKSLNGLKKLELVDEKNPNVIGILTRSCSLPHKNANKWEKEIEVKQIFLKDMIYRYLHVSAQIVPIENRYEDYELDEDGEFTKLPNGIKQPKNIYEACKTLLLASKDNLGLIILNACFNNASFEKSMKEVAGFQVNATIANGPNSNLGVEEERLFKDIEKASRGEIEDPLVKKAAEFILRENLSEEVKLKDEIQRIVTKLKRLQVEDIKELRYIRVGNIASGQSLSNSGKKFLEELQITPEPFETKTSRVIGQGYDIRSDKIVAPQILLIETVDSGYGFIIPSTAKLEEVNQTLSFMEECKDTEAMIKSRLSELNISLPVAQDLFDFEIRAGATMKKFSDTETSSSKASLLREIRLFELKMANYDKMKFTKDFISAVTKLPESFNVNDRADRRMYERFLEKWGQFLVVRAYCGGSVEIEINSKIKSASGQDLTFGELKIILGSIFDAKGSHKKSKDMNTNSILSNCTTNWNGGDINLHIDETIDDPDAMRIWKLSLNERPTMLQHDMSLDPISMAVGRIDPNKEESTFNAIENYLGGEFKRLKSQEAEEKAQAEAKAKEKQREKANTRKRSTLDPPKSSSSWSMIVDSIKSGADWFKSKLFSIFE